MEKKENKFTQDDKLKIQQALNAKGVRSSCPMCGQSNLAVVDGYFNPTLQPHYQGIMLGGASIPSAVVACLNCGFVAQFSLGVLGLLKKEEPSK